ncbi:MAG TPA: urease accessory protein UreE [Opitutaceae bacterium]|nr:urease accessory protein UreE [Opitutaceae bacterium]
MSSFPSAPKEIAIRVDRQKLAKRRWRAAADDGTEFGFEIEAPLRHGDVIWADNRVRYVIRQLPEPVLEIPLDFAPDEAAAIGWAVGNLHFPIDAQPTRLLAPDDSGLRQALDRLGIHYHVAVEIFQPHRLAGSLGGHGHSHGHHPHHHHDDPHGHGHHH